MLVLYGASRVPSWLYVSRWHSMAIMLALTCVALIILELREKSVIIQDLPDIIEFLYALANLQSPYG